MKKQLISALCAAAVSCCALASVPANAADFQRMGDLTQDLCVDAKDAIAVLRISNLQMIEAEEPGITAENCTGDIDMNGAIEPRDANAILQYFNRTLLGLQPLWADIRETSYIDGTSALNPDNPFQLTGLYIEIGCAAGAPGEEVTVPVYVAGCKGLAGFQYYQSTPDALTMTGVKAYTDALGEVPSDSVTNPENGAIVWTSYDGRDIEIADGYLLAEYTYRIPADAEPGTNFTVTADTEHNLFVTEDCVYDSSAGRYQYTLLDGVIHVN